MTSPERWMQEPVETFLHNTHCWIGDDLIFSTPSGVLYPRLQKLYAPLIRQTLPNLGNLSLEQYKELISHFQFSERSKVAQLRGSLSFRSREESEQEYNYIDIRQGQSGIELGMWIDLKGPPIILRRGEGLGCLYYLNKDDYLKGEELQNVIDQGLVKIGGEYCRYKSKDEGYGIKGDWCYATLGRKKILLPSDFKERSGEAYDNVLREASKEAYYIALRLDVTQRYKINRELCARPADVFNPKFPYRNYLNIYLQLMSNKENSDFEVCQTRSRLFLGQGINARIFHWADMGGEIGKHDVSQLIKGGKDKNGKDLTPNWHIRTEINPYLGFLHPDNDQIYILLIINKDKSR
jgi:hypothetical protein